MAVLEYIVSMSEQLEMFKKKRRKTCGMTLNADLWDAFGRRTEEMSVSRSQIVEIMIKKFMEENQQLELIK